MGLSQACAVSAGIALKLTDQPGRAPEGSVVMETDLCAVHRACCGLMHREHGSAPGGCLSNVNKGLQDHWPSLQDTSAMLFVGIALPKQR